MTEAAASVADLGTLVPIAAALVVVNGIDATAAFGVAGLLAIVAGVYYGVPVPVQPIKAAAAIAIATHARPEVIAAAGLLLGAVLVVLGFSGGAALLARIFPKPVIRGNQMGVGILLVIAAVSFVRKAPGADAAALIVAATIVGTLLVAGRRRAAVVLALLAGGIAWSLAADGAPVGLTAGFSLPRLDWPDSSAFATALTLLVIPQLPLTLANAVVGVSDLEREFYGDAARRATPGAFAVSSGVANLAAGSVGGMPLCHGSSGLTAYQRLGARTGGVSIVIGTALLVAGLVFGEVAPAAFGIIPAAVLGGMLAFTGAQHALLVRDQRGAALAIALAMGIVGALTKNLAYGMVLGLPATWLLAKKRSKRERIRS
jgi:MFS superfamily sulfate permease-like transporter